MSTPFKYYILNEQEIESGALDLRYYTKTQADGKYVFKETGKTLIESTILSDLTDGGNTTLHTHDSKADKIYATNLVTNGDFSNGTTGWNTNGSVIGGELSLNTAAGITMHQPSPSLNGSKYYVALDAYHDGTSGIITFKNFTTIAVSNSLSFTLTAIKTRYSGILTNTANGTVLDFARGIAGGIIKLDNIIELNLTTMFGAGKEPTKEQMDWLLAQRYANSWFNGTVELTSISDLLITKSNKVQEAWILATFMNSWVQAPSAPIDVPRYFKDEFGIVHWEGKIANGVANQTAIPIPVGYRIPVGKNKSFYCPRRDGAGAVRVDIGSGTLTPATNPGVDAWIDLSVITYRAEA